MVASRYSPLGFIVLSLVIRLLALLQCQMPVSLAQPTISGFLSRPPPTCKSTSRDITCHFLLLPVIVHSSAQDFVWFPAPDRRNRLTAIRRYYVLTVSLRWRHPSWLELQYYVHLYCFSYTLRARIAFPIPWAELLVSSGY